MISPIYYCIYDIICQSKDYGYGLVTLVRLPGLVLTALSWTLFYHHQASGLSAIKQFYHKRTHTWCAEFKFPDLSSSGLQSGLHEHPSFFVWSLRVYYMCIKIVIHSIIQEWYMHEGQ